MKTKFASLIIALIISTIACQSTATPPASAPVANQVQTAAAGIVLTQTVLAKMQQAPQPTQPPIATDTALPPTAAPQNVLAKVGETVKEGGYIITLANVETAKQFGEFFQAAAGNKLIAVELLIESAASSGVNANPFYVTIKDASGYVYSSSGFGKEPALQSQNDMPIGEKIRGWVTFEIPETATNLVLIYEPLSFTDTIRIRFDLGQ